MDVYAGEWMHRWVHFGKDELDLQPQDPLSVTLHCLASVSQAPAHLSIPLPGAPIQLSGACWHI